MKVPSDDLEKLMRTLSSREKGYFKARINKSPNGKEDNALKLFEHIESKKSIKDYPNYSQNKFQLYQRILSSLHHYHAFKSEKEQLKKNLHVIQLLTGRNLHDQAMKILKKSKKIALKYEYFDYMVILLNLEKRTTARVMKFKFVKELSTQIKHYLNLISITEEYWYIQQIAYQYMIQNTQSDEEANQFLSEVKSNPMLQLDEWKSSAYAKLFYFNAKALIAYHDRDYKETHKNHKSYIGTYEEHPFLLEIQPHIYIIGYNNYLIDCSLIKAYEEFEIGLEYLNEKVKEPIFRKIRNVESLIYKMTIVSRLDMLYMSYNFDKVYPILKDLKSNIVKHKLATHEKVALKLIAGASCFFLKKYEEANEWIVDLLQSLEDKHETGIIRHSRILNLLIQLELGNYQYLEYLVKNTKRTLKKENELSETEDMIFFYLQKLIKCSIADQKSVWSEFKKKVLLLDKNDKIFTFIHVKRWINER